MKKTVCFKHSKYVKIACALIVSIVAVITSCSGKKDNTYQGMYIYCVNATESQVAGEEYTLKSKGTENQINEFILQMQKEPQNISLKKSIPDDMILKEHTLSESGDLCMYWTTSYTNYTGIAEVLRRAAIVKTLCQIDGVNTVEFYVAGQPLTDTDMNTIGYMSADTFVDNTGKQVYMQEITLNIYFAYKNGTKLKKVPISITYDASIPVEQLVVEQLIKGPEDIQGQKEKDIVRTIPSSTKINKISIRDNTCYIDLSNDFMEKISDVSNEVAVYSVVNTLTSLSAINRVQFSIDGKQDILFDDMISFGNSFETNLDLVE